MTLTKKIKKILASLWPVIKQQLKGRFIKLALKKILGSGAAFGFKAWLIKTIAVELFDELAVPLFQYLYRKGMLVIDKQQGKVKVKKLKKAEREGDEDTYIDIVDNA